MEKELVRSVVRAFHGTEPTIIVDALVNHSALTMEDTREIFRGSRQRNDLGKTYAKLMEAGLVSKFVRQETKAGALKATSVEYYYIDYRYAIDATKYRLHVLGKSLEDKAKPTSEKAEFVCPQCGTQWTLLDAVDYPDPQARGSGFLCKTCNHLLDVIPIGKEEELDHNNPLSKFNRQLEWLIRMLDKIDRIVIPEYTGEAAVESKKAVPREKGLGMDVMADHPELQPKVKPTAVMGLKAQAEKVEITLTTEEENNAAAQQAEQERKAKIAAQNQLPSWHTESTIQPGERPHNGDALKVEDDSQAAVASAAKDKKQAEEDSVIAYFKELQEQQRLEELRRQQEEDEADSDEEDDDDDDDDDDDEEFEEVEVSPPDAKKRRLEDTDSARASESVVNTPLPATENNTPANGAESDEDEEFEQVV